MLENSPWHYGFENLKVKENCPKIYEYVHRTRELPLIKDQVTKANYYHNWMRDFANVEMGTKALLSLDNIETEKKFRMKYIKNMLN